MRQYAILPILALQVSAQPKAPPEAVSGKKISKPVRFLSPLQSLTLFPKEIEESSPTSRRQTFLPKFKATLEAEKAAKEQVAWARERNAEEYANISTGEGWEEQVKEMEKRREEKEEAFVDRAITKAVSKLPSSVSKTEAGKNLSKYQFVGLVQPSSSDQKVQWYARKRPKNSKWNVRLLHPNRKAILHDLFTRGKVDIYGEYVNKPVQEEVEVGEDGETVSKPSYGPNIEPLYSIKERSFRSVLSFS